MTDIGFTGTLFAQPAFQRQFGQPYDDGYEIPAEWQGAMLASLKIGHIIGVFMDGHFSEVIGRKKVSLATLVILAGMIFIQFFAKSLPVFLVGRMLAGIPIGVFQAAANTYAAEVCPVVLRAFLTTYVCLCWVMGQFICAGVTYRLSSVESEWGWRIVIAVQWAWIPPLFLLLLFAPDSPWWLVRKGRYEQAERAVLRLTDGSVNTKDAVAMMKHTTQLEIETQSGSSYWACFKGTNIRRTEIACVIWAIQAGIGNPLQGYTTYFFRQAGLSTENAFKFNVGNNATSFVGTILAWPLLYYFGRRTVFMGGLAAMTVLYFAIGFAGIPPITDTSANWARSSLLVIYLFIYCPTVGATAYPIIGEVGASRLRGKTVALARGSYLVVSIVSGVLVPYMLSPTAWDWGAKTGFFYGGIACGLLVWTFFRLPEMKGRTYEELDILFERRVPARKFKGEEVNAYEGYEGLVAEKKDFGQSN